MSLEEPTDSTPELVEESLPTTGDELEELLGEHVIRRDDHLNAPGFEIRPDAVQDVLFALRDEAGFDHLSCVTAQEYEDRYESIYHLTSYDDRTREVSVVVPTAKDAPKSQTAEPVFRTADWHEREAYDMFGINFVGHPNLKRILCPEDWEGHALRKDYEFPLEYHGIRGM